MKSDLPSQMFSRIAYKIHPKLGHLYTQHAQFFNDGLVEFICLMIGSGFIVWLSHYFVGFALAVVLTLTATPITFCLKFLLHKYWVWKK